MTKLKIKYTESKTFRVDSYHVRKILNSFMRVNKCAYIPLSPDN